MSLAALTDSTTAIVPPRLVDRAHFRQLDVNHVGQLGLRVIGNADPDLVAFAADPFVRFGVKKVVWNVHDFL